MEIPLYDRLKRKAHRDIALLQDRLVDAIYEIAPSAVMHGGTAIWRCHGANRFSEDVDFYLKKGEWSEKRFRDAMARAGLSIVKYKDTGNTIFSKISDGVSEVRFEANFRMPEKESIMPIPYERADGGKMDIFSIMPGPMLMEKAEAYISRKLMRDIYDVYFLSSIASPDEAKDIIKKALDIEPIDKDSLSAIVYSGAVPSIKQIKDVLRSRFSV
jgi:predicted nucleotidyltransferase component of viral defense system